MLYIIFRQITPFKSLSKYVLEEPLFQAPGWSNTYFKRNFRKGYFFRQI